VNFRSNISSATRSRFFECALKHVTPDSLARDWSLRRAVATTE
jgi:hypothetical protein